VSDLAALNRRSSFGAAAQMFLSSKKSAPGWVLSYQIHRNQVMSHNGGNSGGKHSVIEFIVDDIHVDAKK